MQKVMLAPIIDQFNNQRRPLTRELSKLNPVTSPTDNQKKMKSFRFVSDMVATLHGVPSDEQMREESNQLIREIVHGKIFHRHHLKYDSLIEALNINYEQVH
jgi:hypothetical protein